MSRTLGLRGRLTIALLGISVLVLVIAGVALLAPLDGMLRDDALRSLAEEARTAKPRFEAVPALAPAARELARQADAEVAVVDERGNVLVATDADASGPFTDAVRAIHENRLVKGTTTGAEGREAQVAIPLDAGGRRLGLALRKSLDDLAAARGAVERALLVAALIALACALIAGSALARRLVRRLAALRDTSLRLADLGPLAEVHDDGARDEIGDLGRAFATMHRRLREQEQARRTFVATASHELRTPLASLQLTLHSAAEDLGCAQPDVRDAREQLERAVAQTERLSRLAAELLDLSRLDARVALRAERIELTELARSVIAELEPRTRRTGTRLQLSGPPHEWATGDPGSVAQIVRILLDNALQHTPPGCPIEVAVGPVAGRPAITVTDAGPGVAVADAERIFERFERGAGASGEGGFGLGLAIGRELAHRMGGDLVLARPGPRPSFRLSLEAAGT